MCGEGDGERERIGRGGRGRGPVGGGGTCLFVLCCGARVDLKNEDEPPLLNDKHYLSGEFKPALVDR